MKAMSEDTGAKGPNPKSGGPAQGPAAKTGEPGKREIGGRKGPEPTRYGDWERNGRCSDF